MNVANMYLFLITSLLIGKPIHIRFGQKVIANTRLFENQNK